MILSEYKERSYQIILPSNASTLRSLNLVDTLAKSVFICKVNLPSADARITTTGDIHFIRSMDVRSCFNAGSSMEIWNLSCVNDRAPYLGLSNLPTYHLPLMVGVTCVYVIIITISLFGMESSFTQSVAKDY